MPFNLYTFILSDRFANEEFNKRNVPNPEAARRTALIASLLGPANGGGINAAAVPSIIAKEAARREAEAAEAQRLSDIQKSLALYESFVTKPVGNAKKTLGQNFSVVVKDEKGNPFEDAPEASLVASQDPVPKEPPQSLPKGTQVTLVVNRPSD